jgi:hypothetical protein
MTVKYLFDVHVHVGIVQGLWQRLPELVIVEARLHFPRTKDDELLVWAAENGFILVSLDTATMIYHAYTHIVASLHTRDEHMAGLFILRQGVSLGDIIESLYEIAVLSERDEWIDRVTFIPL